MGGGAKGLGGHVRQDFCFFTAPPYIVVPEPLAERIYCVAAEVGRSAHPASAAETAGT